MTELIRPRKERLHFNPVYFSVEYIGYRSQTGDGLPSFRETTRKAKDVLWSNQQ
jgi:hypothetical protein